MTYEEALNVIGNTKLQFARGDGKTSFFIALCVATEALDKQIPKTITHEATLYKCCTCPSCGNVVGEFEKWGEKEVRITEPFCKICGQALDWNDN